MHKSSDSESCEEFKNGMISGLYLLSDSGLKKGENKKLKYLFACR
jgi:hypothetical protein